jgi:hypothetical protein
VKGTSSGPPTATQPGRGERLPISTPLPSRFQKRLLGEGCLGATSWMRVRSGLLAVRQNARSSRFCASEAVDGTASPSSLSGGINAHPERINRSRTAGLRSGTVRMPPCSDSITSLPRPRTRASLPCRRSPPGLRKGDLRRLRPFGSCSGAYSPLAPLRQRLETLAVTRSLEVRRAQGQTADQPHTRGACAMRAPRSPTRGSGARQVRATRRRRDADIAHPLRW